MYQVTARLTVREGELEGFKRQAAEMVRLAREKDTKTLRYDWFLSDDGAQCEVHEVYVDADALVEHARHVGEARDKLFRHFADGHHMTFYEEPSPMLAEAMKAIPPGAVKVTRFSYFQGLDAGGEAPHEIPA
jgi:quinol monooxygenase YgiN